METCPFCNAIFTGSQLIEHLARQENREDYARLKAIGLRFQHQEQQLDINRVLRGLR